MLWASTAGAGGGALPPDQVNDVTTRWLAVAMVAEAGWLAEADHRAIYHVLRRRWPRLQKRRPKRYSDFVSVVQGYVAAMDPRTSKGGRVRWLLQLELGREDAPTGWPERANWEKHRVWWVRTVERARDCIAGRRCRDPYKGQALHWGGDMDSPSGCMVELPNAGTANTFYSVDVECARKRRRGRRER